MFAAGLFVLIFLMNDFSVSQHFGPVRRQLGRQQVNNYRLAWLYLYGLSTELSRFCLNFFKLLRIPRALNL